MSREFKLPELGENIESALVVKVLIAPGDIVKEDQTIIEIETDKATVEVPSDIAGKVSGVYIKEGDKVPVGAVVFSVEDAGSAAASAPAADVKATSAGEKAPTGSEAPAKDGKKTAPASGGAGSGAASGAATASAGAGTTADASASASAETITDVVLPDLGENITEAMVVKVTVKPGDEIKENDTILEIETDKATVEVPSSASGVVTEVFAEANKHFKVGAVILKVKSVAAKPAPAPATPAGPSPEEVEKSKVAVMQHKIAAPSSIPVPVAGASAVSIAGGTVQLSEAELKELKEDLANPELIANPPKIFLDMQPPILQNAAPAAPSVRRLAREVGVDIRKVPGTGPGGRISLNDVKAYSKALHEGRVSEQPQAGGGGAFLRQQPLPDFSKFGDIERKAMSSIRAKTASHLSYSWATIPHVTQFDKADITILEQLRKQYSPEVAKGGGKLTMTSILVKVISAALKQFPQFNSSVDMEKQEIVYKNYYNIGIAVDTEHGLIVPNIKGTDKMNLTQISAQIAVLSEKARAKKIGLDELQGGCFTISNLGGIGGTYFTPVVNSPEVAILGVSRGLYEQVYRDGEFVPRLMLPLSLSYDHRVIDGADAIRFLRWVVEVLESPFKLLVVE